MNKASLIIIMFLLGFATNYLLVIFFGVETFSSATQGYGVKSYVEMKDKLTKLNEKMDNLDQVLKDYFNLTKNEVPKLIELEEISTNEVNIPKDSLDEHSVESTKNVIIETEREIKESNEAPKQASPVTP